MKLAVVLVHYHTPELLEAACDALTADACATGLDLEGVVVDNGSRPEDRDLLESLPFRLLSPGRNLGYAGGVNLGTRETTADHIVVMNPDVQVLSGCLAALIAALDDGAGAAGPRFYWDHGRRFLLPPTEEVSRRAELLRLLAERSPAWATRARERWRRHAWRHWLAEEPLPSYDLSGALLAIDRAAWRQIGPFDDTYPLYFEETDWLLRLRRAGLDACWVPQAQAVHLFAQSTLAESRAEGWFLNSQRRFRRQAYGTIFTRCLELLGRLVKPAAVSALEPGPEGHEAAPEAAAWLEVSASSAGYPAAGRRLPIVKRGDDGTQASELPSAIYTRLGPGTYTLRSVDKGGRELGTRRLAKS